LCLQARDERILGSKGFYITIIHIPIAHYLHDPVHATELTKLKTLEFLIAESLTFNVLCWFKSTIGVAMAEWSWAPDYES